MITPWLSVPIADYKIHMEHESVRQGEMIRRHLEDRLARFDPKSILYLGAGIGNGLESARSSQLSDILAVDVNPEYLAYLQRRFEMLTALRTEQCSFPEGFSEPGRFELAYGALHFEYVDLESTLAAIGVHLTPKVYLVALLQQQSEHGKMASSGVASLEAVLPIMSLHTPGAFRYIAEQNGRFRHISTMQIASRAVSRSMKLPFKGHRCLSYLVSLLYRPEPRRMCTDEL